MKVWACVSRLTPTVPSAGGLWVICAVPEEVRWLGRLGGWQVGRGWGVFVLPSQLGLLGQVPPLSEPQSPY